MNVIIRDFDRPEKCWGCNFCIRDLDYDRYYCAVNGDWIDFSDGEINPDCPVAKYEKPEWVPVSERLPEKRTIVLISHAVPFDKQYDVTSAGFYWEGKWHEGDGRLAHDVHAWMPMPLPYVGKSS